MMQIMAEWFIVNDDRLTFTVEVTLFVGFIFISILLFSDIYH